MKRRDFLKVVGGVAAVTAVGAVAAKPRAAKARVCERNVGTLRAIYPVNSIYISAADINPADLFGFGTWVRFGEGEVLAGVSSTDSDFDFRANFAVRGEKSHTLTTAQTPSHTHNAHVGEFCPDINGRSGTAPWSHASGVFSYGAGFTASMTDSSGANSRGLRNMVMNAEHSSVGGGEAHNNLQPYITVFMWRRSA